MKVSYAGLAAILIVTFCSAGRAQGAAFTNSAQAVKYLEDFAKVGGTKFGEQQPSLGDPRLDRRRICAYFRANRDDTNFAARAIALAKTWANVETANGEIALADKANDADKRLTLVRLWQMRVEYAWTILTEGGCIHEGMKRDDAVALLGKPRIEMDTYKGEPGVLWALAGGLHKGTWMRAAVDAEGRLHSMRWTDFQ